MNVFKYTAEVPTEDGKGVEKTTFTFRPISKVPVAVLRRNRNNPEEQMWATFEWGLTAEQMDAFDRLPAGLIEEILEAWQESEEGDQDKPEGPPPTPGE